MRIVFVLTYPVHYAAPRVADWLGWDNRDRRMAALVKAMGVDVELWGVADQPFDGEVPVADLGSVRIRLFGPRDASVPAREATSETLCAAAAADSASLFVLIGVDGAAGLDLHDRVLAPGGRRYALVIGGSYWSRIVPRAALLFTESQRQEDALDHPGWRFWRKGPPRERRFRLPKTVDTARFRPIAAAPRYDVVAVARLVKYKNFDEIGALSTRFRVAVAGSGPRQAELAARYPRVDWLGHVPHADLPALLGAARIYVHPGRQEWFPRAIPEAMACGLPVVAFDDRFGPDIVPPETGLLVGEPDYRASVAALLADPARIEAMGAAARAHVERHHGPRSSEAACRRLIEVAR